MKRTILFDLGNVLIFFDHQKMCSQVAEYSGLDFELVQSLMLKHGDSYERGHLQSQMIYEEMCQIAPRKLHFESLMHAISDIFQPNLPVIELAKQIKEKGHRLFLLSNTCEPHFEFAYSKFPFLKLFDGYVLSYKVGLRKPELKIYEKAIEMTGTKNRTEYFYIDDILDYIESARSLQIDAEKYTNPEELTQHLHARGIL